MGRSLSPAGLSPRVGCEAVLTFARLTLWGGEERSGHGVSVCTASVTPRVSG